MCMRQCFLSLPSKVSVLQFQFQTYLLQQAIFKMEWSRFYFSFVMLLLLLPWQSMTEIHGTHPLVTQGQGKVFSIKKFFLSGSLRRNQIFYGWLKSYMLHIKIISSLIQENILVQDIFFPSPELNLEMNGTQVSATRNEILFLIGDQVGWGSRMDGVNVWYTGDSAGMRRGQDE